MPKVNFQGQQVEIHAKELALILAIRNKFQYGEIVVIVRDGRPQYIKSAWVNDHLEDLGGTVNNSPRRDTTG